MLNGGQAGARRASWRPRWGHLAVLVLVVLLSLEGVAQRLVNADLRWLFLLALATGLAFVATPVAGWLAHRLGILDIPGGRKAHEAPTALLGGVAVFVAFAATVTRNFSFSRELKGVVVAGALVFGIGMVDDWRGLPAHLKLAAQVVAVAVLVQHGVAVNVFPPGAWQDGAEWLLTGLWVIGVTNAVNFLDGMDGLAAGMMAIVAAFFGLAALQNHHDFMVYLSMPLLGACLGFLPYNLRPGRRALIFLGDAGSTFIGFTAAALGIIGDWAGQHVARLLVPVLILGVPIFDMTFTTVMRIRAGQVRSLRQWLEFTGRDHFHHRLAALRLGNLGSVLVIYIVTLWLGLSALALKNAAGLAAHLQVGEAVVVFVMMAFFMVFVPRQYDQIDRQRRDNDTR